MYLHVKNKDGVDCEYTEELAQDLLAVYKIDIKNLFENIHGTIFNIEKNFEKQASLVFGRPMLKFTLTTNDERDEPIVFTLFP